MVGAASLLVSLGLEGGPWIRFYTKTVPSRISSKVPAKVPDNVDGVASGGGLPTSCPERPGGDGGEGGGIRRIQNKFGEIVWRRKPTSQASNSPNKRCRRSKTGRCLVHRCPYVEVCQRERWLKRGDDGKISVETKEVYREVCEIFAREGGLNYDRGGKSEGGRLSDASHVNRKLTDSHSSGRPAT